MALELHTLLSVDRYPTRSEWQSAVNELSLPVSLDPELALPSTTGFRPCTLNGSESGCEIHIDSAADLISRYPSLATPSSRPTLAISFRWSGSLDECACAMALAAGLVHKWAAVAYYPDDDMIYDLEGLQNDFRSCLDG